MKILKKICQGLKKGLEISILIDNYVELTGLKAEHGLSMIVEEEDHRILFDCGQSSQIIKNAKKLNLELDDLNQIVLSHGHFDHTGGLLAVLELNKNIDVYGHPGIFDKKYSRKKQQKYIGIQEKREFYEKKGANFILSAESIKLTKNIYTTGQIPGVTSFEKVDESFIKMKDDEYKKDEILDDLSLVIERKEGIILILGCAHSGIINTLKHVVDMTGRDNFLLITGGMHLAGKENYYVEKILEEINRYKINCLVPAHCSGAANLPLFEKYFGDKLIYGSTGKVFKFN